VVWLLAFINVITKLCVLAMTPEKTSDNPNNHKRIHKRMDLLL
jgi:hypothetical protein